MIYELRVYDCAPGRKADVLARFRNHTMGLFRTHGIHVVGFWEVLVGETNQIIYVTRYTSWEERQERYGAFESDPEWHRVRQETNARGRIVQNVHTALLAATDFSPSV